MGYNESKFLGGDLSRTHMVKGLDYLLLAKIRSKGDEASSTGVDFDAEIDAALDGTGVVSKQGLANNSNEGIEMLGAWAAGIVAVALTVHPIKPPQCPLPTRTMSERLKAMKSSKRLGFKSSSFSFPIDSGLDDWEPPLTHLDSSDVVYPSDLTISGFLEPLILSQISASIKTVKHSTFEKSLAEPSSGPLNAPFSKDRATSPSRVILFAPTKNLAQARSSPIKNKEEKEEEEEEDIFCGVGKYVPITTSMENTLAKSSSLVDKAPPDKVLVPSTRTLPPTYLRLQHVGDSLKEEAIFDEWDKIESTETMAEERVRLAEEAKLASSTESMVRISLIKGGVKEKPMVDPLSRGGIQGCIQDDCTASYELEGVSVTGYTHELCDEIGDATFPVIGKKGCGVNESTRLENNPPLKKVLTTKRGREDDYSSLGGVFWGLEQVKTAQVTADSVKYSTDSWSAQDATGGKINETDRRKKETEAQNKLAQFMERKK